MDDQPWYQDGLHFHCRTCGLCCKGGRGNVFLSDIEIDELAQHFDTPNETFREEYTRTNRNGELQLREKRNKDCILFKRDLGCTAYEHRPLQCRTYPFWNANLYTKESWQDESRKCPGIDAGPLHQAAEIKIIAKNDGIEMYVKKRRA